MKKLLIIVFAFSYTSTFAQDQEKKGVCAAAIQLFRDNTAESTPNDHFSLNGFNLNEAYYTGSFQIDSTTWADSLIYEITLPFGDSLMYSAYWIADGMCPYSLDSADVNSLVTVLEGTPFPIVHYVDYYSFLQYDLSQAGVIRNSCLFQIQRKNIPGKKYFVRVKFLDPPVQEEPLNLPEITNDISMWLNSENTLFVKTDETTVWNAELYSLSGQVIQKYRLEGSQTLDISTLPKGCYVAHISSENGLKKQLKFIR